MRHSNKNIIEAYLELFEGLSLMNKLELIDSLSKSLKAEDSLREDNFYSSFGAFVSEKSAEEIINEIRANRNFRDKDLEL